MNDEVKVRFSSDGSEIEYFEVETVKRDYLNRCLILRHKNGVITQIPNDKYDYIEIGNDVISLNMHV
ncbi:hypothetical protein [Macrococcus capreoli]|uniref:hypothetical protein n=1 Tax=Macrococcus capreoli TaxID=2982690 RepID=UPI003EE66F16